MWLFYIGLYRNKKALKTFIFKAFSYLIELYRTAGVIWIICKNPLLQKDSIGFRNSIRYQIRYQKIYCPRMLLKLEMPHIQITFKNNRRLHINLADYNRFNASTICESHIHHKLILLMKFLASVWLRLFYDSGLCFPRKHSHNSDKYSLKE